ncbi:MAG: hypothetical protein ACYC7E_23320 [Armatimonadota bacterium]
MQVSIPDRVSFESGNGESAGQFVVRVADAHNATDAELTRYKADNDSKTDLLFAKIDKLQWWIIGLLVMVVFTLIAVVTK